jgi:hypothetical protein
MTNLITHIDKCLLKWIWFNTNRRYTWHCLLLFGVTNNRVYNDAFHTFTFSMPQSVSFTWPKKIRIILLILDLKLGTIDNRKDYSDVQTWGEFFFFIIIIVIFFFLIKTGIRDFLLDIYSAYKSFVWTAALGLEISGSNDIVLILPLY